MRRALSVLGRLLGEALVSLAAVLCGLAVGGALLWLGVVFFL